MQLPSCPTDLQVPLAPAAVGDRTKTIVCSVLFLDIVEYSKKPVSWQISLKQRFSVHLSAAIRDVPADDRIILDTGDGAALSFLGDVENALQVALKMRDFLREGQHEEPPLHLRMGINLGPVRIVRDINGRPSIVGDGINVAERVAGFSDPGQILVSRAYHDAASRLSPEHAAMFSYQGERTDKHVRAHAIYAVGLPGQSGGIPLLQSETQPAVNAATVSKARAETIFQRAWPFSRALHATVPVASVAAYVMLLAIPVILLMRPGTLPTQAVAVAETAPAPVAAAVASALAPPLRKIAAHGTPNVLPGKGRLVVSCVKGTSVFVDGQAGGKIESVPMTFRLGEGKHFIILIHPAKSRVHTEYIDLAEGKSVRMHAVEFCS